MTRDPKDDTTQRSAAPTLRELPAVTLRTGQDDAPTEDNRTLPGVGAPAPVGLTLPAAGRRLSLAGARIGDLVAALGQARATAQIDVVDGAGRPGTVVVKDGSVDSATYSGEAGPRALLSILGLQTGTFRVAYDGATTERDDVAPTDPDDFVDAPTGETVKMVRR